MLSVAMLGVVYVECCYCRMPFILSDECYLFRVSFHPLVSNRIKSYEPFTFIFWLVYIISVVQTYIQFSHLRPMNDCRTKINKECGSTAQSSKSFFSHNLQM
jgi:hypothetical protein